MNCIISGISNIEIGDIVFASVYEFQIISMPYAGAAYAYVLLGLNVTFCGNHILNNEAAMQCNNISYSHVPASSSIVK